MFGAKQTSIKQYMDSWDEVMKQARVLLDAYQAVLLSLETGAAAMRGGEGLQLHESMTRINALLKRETSSTAIQQSGTATEKAIQDLVVVLNRREIEYKEIIRMLAELGATIAGTGTAQGQELVQMAAKLERVAQVDSIVEARKLLSVNISELRVMATRVQEEATERASQLARELDTARERFRFAAALAETDPLTGLANRRKADNAVQAAIRKGTPFCFLLIDLDGFKAINDKLGHNQGDSLLKAIAQHLRRAVRDGDIVCRWGGDEFVVVMLGAPLSAARNTAARLQANAFGRFMLSRAGEGVEVAIGASIGIAEYAPPETAAALYERADLLMYEEKAKAKAVPVAKTAGAVGA